MDLELEALVDAVLQWCRRVTPIAVHLRPPRSLWRSRAPAAIGSTDADASIAALMLHIFNAGFFEGHAAA